MILVQKSYCLQRGLGYFENSGIKEGHQGNKRLHLNKKGNSALAKNLLRCFDRKEFIFGGFITPKKANSDVYSNLENIRKNNSNKTIFTFFLNINSIRKKDFLVDIVKYNVDILIS